MNQKPTVDSVLRDAGLAIIFAVVFCTGAFGVAYIFATIACSISPVCS